jgi:hypothetical protein
MTVRGLLSIAFAASALLALPAPTFAMQSTAWDFRGGQLPGKWDVSQTWSVNPSTDGLHITTNGDGRMLRAPLWGETIDTVTFSFLSARPTEALLLWHQPGQPEDTLVQLPFTIDAGTQPSLLTLDMGTYAAWNGHPDRLGFALPAGSDLTLQAIQLNHWSALEKTAEAWRAFWVMDKFHGYSINFLWGPLLTFNPVGRSELFTTLPPKGMSAIRVFYYAIGILGLLLLAHWAFITQRGRRPFLASSRLFGPQPHLRLFVLVCAVAWVLFDARMGLELLSYAKADLDTYVRKPAGERTLRDHQNFEDIVMQSLPELRSRPVFLYLGPAGTPFAGRLRYFAYPSLPVTDAADLAKTDTVLVVARDDIAVDAQGRLTADGKPMTGTGKILKRFDDTSFLYRTDPR